MTFSSQHVTRSMSRIFTRMKSCVLPLQPQDTLNKGSVVSVKGMSQQPHRNIPEACVLFTHITLPSITAWHNSPKPEFTQSSLGSGYRLTCRAAQKINPACSSQTQAQTLLPIVTGDRSHLSSLLRDPNVPWVHCRFHLTQWYQTSGLQHGQAHSSIISLPGRKIKGNGGD